MDTPLGKNNKNLKDNDLLEFLEPEQFSSEIIKQKEYVAKRIRTLHSTTEIDDSLKVLSNSYRPKPLGFFPSIESEIKKTKTIKSIKNVPWSGEPTFQYPLQENNEKCTLCGSIELDFSILENFNVKVCYKCKKQEVDDYKLLTKSSASELYLLTDEELKDEISLPRMTKVNPHNSNWSDMQLYLNLQLKKFAYKKWGGSDGLNRELEMRSKLKSVRKIKIFDKKIKDLRKKTRPQLIKRITDSKKHHVHSFITIIADTKKKSCDECGLIIECEEI